MSCGPKIPVKESLILKAALDRLAAEHVLAFRMNSGAVRVGRRFLRFGVAGMADVLAFPRNSCPCWIECKSDRGRQSPVQKSFEQRVREHGHEYVLVRTPEDLEAWLMQQRHSRAGPGTVVAILYAYICTYTSARRNG